MTVFCTQSTPNDGEELWSFIPRQLLERTLSLVENETTDPEERAYGLDGNIRLLIFDNNSNGVIEPDDVRWTSATARCCSSACVVAASPTSPGRLRKEPAQCCYGSTTTLPGVGQTWSTPQPARVRTDSGDKLVLFVSGGYAPDHEDVTGTPPAWQQYPNPDDAGNRIYMLDMFDGSLLWSAGPVRQRCGSGIGGHEALPLRPTCASWN